MVFPSQLFHSNFDRSTMVKSALFAGIVAKRIRFLPKSFYQAACLRVELFGTKKSTGKALLILRQIIIHSKVSNLTIINNNK